MSRALLAAVLGAVLAVIAACSSDEGGREVVITQTDNACTPENVTAARGEKLKLVIRNESSGDKEFEGIEGTKLSEMEVPKGSSRTKSWTAPADAGVAKFKCYVPGGSATIISVTVS